MYLLSLGTITSPTQAGALLAGKYGYSSSNVKLLLSPSKNQDIINLLSGNQATETNKSQDLQVDLSQKLDSLESVDQLNKQIEDYYQVFLDEPTNLTQEEAEAILDKELAGLPNADQINQDIQERYLGLLEEDTEMMGMIDARKLLSSEDNLLGAEFAEGAEIDPEQAVAMLQGEGLLDALPGEKGNTFPLPLIVGFSLILMTVMAPIFLAVGKVLEEGIVEGLQEKYGKPKAPEKAVTLHNKTFRELKTLANRALRISDEKFGSEEFMVYIKLKKQVDQGLNEYQTIGQSIKYLEVAIAAQSSFLKLESTELRFRSRKQQEFYNFVADTISDDLDKDVFRDKVKKKLGQILPLLNSEEGRNALQSYIKEVNEISKHDLGLKLLALFKKYQLADFTILRTVSDITQQLDAQDLFQLKGLIVLVLENYDVFEKLSPIIGVSEEEHSPETYAKMLQYMGLVNRHSKAYQEFILLLNTLKKWEKPYKSLTLIREQYSASEYRIPPQFSTELPGVALYEKYKKHLHSEQFSKDL
ncbi:hypothetical protein Xen7305DRAFT_00022920 [Xenococcus sp. PCC 7305]|nr:hypothetical protein Xen7305DRAFT_00022920 [Xenococcus sp. PCC 7305]